MHLGSNEEVLADAFEAIGSTSNPCCRTALAVRRFRTDLRLRSGKSEVLSPNQRMLQTKRKAAKRDLINSRKGIKEAWDDR